MNSTQYKITNHGQIPWNLLGPFFQSIDCVFYIFEYLSSYQILQTAIVAAKKTI